MRTITIAAALICGLMFWQAYAGEPQVLTDNDKNIRAYLSAQARLLESEFLKDVKTAADFEARRPKMKQEFFHMMGLWPLPEKTPLNAKITGQMIMEPEIVTLASGEKSYLPGYIIEKLHFQSRPGLYVTGNLYRPRTDHFTDPKPKYPTILYQCGHSQQKRDGNKTGYHDHGIWFATHGYVCLMIDTLQLGEIAAIHHGTYRENRWWWHSAGYTSAGVECWNAIRALDYLCTRPEVDTERIGATGISGGGSATMWISVADERIKAAAPVSGMADLGHYVCEDGVNGHCDCMFLYNSARWNWTEIPALIAPRPLLFVNSDADPIFPMSANDRVINRLSGLYARFGAGDKVSAVVSVGGHAYRTDLRRAIFEFFNRHLKRDAAPVVDADAGLNAEGKHRLEKSSLRVFPTDADIPADQINTKVDQVFVPRAKVNLPKPEEFTNWRNDLLEKLRAAAFSAWPAATPEVSFQPLKTAPEEGKETTEPNVTVHYSWHPAANVSNVCFVILNADDTPGKVPEWAKEAVADGSAFLIAPRGAGPGAWTRKSPPNTVERSMALIGATVDSGRIWDIITMIKRRSTSGITLRLAGRGQAGILAAYAMLYEPQISAITIVDPPVSHMPKTEGGEYGPPLLSVLRVLDIPEALGCLAPRNLTLVGAQAADFSRTKELYKISGAEANLRIK
ncbi:MAG TPA: prolyl oligopeptidase family serine peptidase [Planctomycetota bacterium]|nr:prolyl oligopeptidase family serine peptidase [Planctomycetota bacterium]